MNTWDELLKEYDEIVYIPMSSGLSGSYQTAAMLSEDYEGRVFVVNNQRICPTLRDSVEDALVMASEGKTGLQIKEKLEDVKFETTIYIMVGTLEYLKKGGRISATVALAGGMLAIKPVVALEDGVIVMKGKARGSKNAENLFITTINASGGIDFSKPYRVGYTGLSDHLVKKYIEDSSSMWDKYVDDIPYQTIGGTIGTHVGPGAVAAAFFPKHPERLQNLTKNS